MGKFFFFLSCCLWMGLSSNAQDVTPPPVQTEFDDDHIYTVVEVIPEYPGGLDSLMKYVSAVGYPSYARTNGMYGTVYIEFVVSSDGSIKDAKVARGTGYAFLDSISLAHVAQMPSWKPGTQNGKAVNVKFTVPIKFVLEANATIFTVVEDMPDFPGGEKVLDKYLANAPAPAGYTKKQLADKQTYIKAVVNENGAITDVVVARTSGNKELDNAAINHVKGMPRWNPGTQRGKKVKVYVTVKVAFVPVKK